jgi:TetR/AcrR family transcriptional regulator, transcriptional repressor for nem operon
METKEQILDTAQRLLQQKGFNGFSYADIAEEVGIRKASLHHHFPGKVDLGIALIEKYSADFGAALDAIGASRKAPKAKLLAYVALYRATLEQGRMCLCGMLASDALTLDAAMHPPLKRFFARNTEWLAATLLAGRSDGSLFFAGTPTDQARLFLAALQGALLVARVSDDRETFDKSTSTLIQQLTRKG